MNRRRDRRAGYLPLIEVTVARAEPDKAAPPPQAGAETVLLVEDEAALRGMIGKTLTQGGYRVLEAATPGEALDVARTHQGTIHVVLTDVVMPEMNGRELAVRLEKLRPDARVIYMSGYTDAAIGQHGLLDPGTLFLQKPFTSDALLWKIQEALAGVRRQETSSDSVSVRGSSRLISSAPETAAVTK